MLLAMVMLRSGANYSNGHDHPERDCRYGLDPPHPQLYCRYGLDPPHPLSPLRCRYKLDSLPEPDSNVAYVYNGMAGSM